MSELMKKIMDLWEYAGEYITYTKERKSVLYFEKEIDDIRKLALAQEQDNTHLTTQLEIALDWLDKWRAEGCDCPPEGHVCGYPELSRFIDQTRQATKAHKETTNDL